MAYIKLNNGQIVEYPDFFRKQGYDVTYTPTQFSLYCLEMHKPSVVCLDSEAGLLYIKDEQHPYPFVDDPDGSVLGVAPVGIDTTTSQDLAGIIHLLVINDADRKHYLYAAADINKMAEHPNGKGYGAVWTDKGLIFVAEVEEYVSNVEITPNPDPEGENAATSQPVIDYRWKLL